MSKRFRIIFEGPAGRCEASAGTLAELHKLISWQVRAIAFPIGDLAAMELTEAVERVCELVEAARPDTQSAIDVRGYTGDMVGCHLLGYSLEETVAELGLCGLRTSISVVGRYRQFLQSMGVPFGLRRRDRAAMTCRPLRTGVNRGLVRRLTSS